MHYTCRDLLWRPMTFAGPNNYLQVPGFFRKSRLAVKFKFRSWDYTGLLMFTRFADDLGSLELGLSEGQVNITITQPGNKRLRFAAGNTYICLLIHQVAILQLFEIILRGFSEVCRRLWRPKRGLAGLVVSM